MKFSSYSVKEVKVIAIPTHLPNYHQPVYQTRNHQATRASLVQIWSFSILEVSLPLDTDLGAVEARRVLMKKSMCSNQLGFKGPGNKCCLCSLHVVIIS